MKDAGTSLVAVANAIVVLTLAFFLFVFVSGLAREFVDDTFITFRYVEQLVANGFPTWHPALPPVDGFTSAGHVLILAALRYAGLSIIVANSILQFGTVLLMLATLYSVTRRYRLSARIVALGMICLNSSIALWVGAGLDSVPYALIFLLTYIAAEHSVARGGFTWQLTLALVALSLMRPEGAIVACGIVGFFLLRRWFGTDSRHVYGMALVLAAFILSMVLVRLSLYGHPLPNAVYAKRGETLLEIQAGLTNLSRWVQFGGGGLIVLNLLGLLSGSGAWLRGLFILGQCALVVMVGGDFHPGYRFLMPVIPLIALDAAYLFERWAIHRASLTRAVAVVLVLGFYFLIQGLPLRGADGFPTAIRGSVEAIADGRWPFRSVADAPVTHDRTLAAKELSSLLPEDTPLAATDVGILAYNMDQPVIDILGLNNAEYAHLPKPPGFRNIWGVLQIDHAVQSGVPAILFWFPEYMPWTFESQMSGGPPCSRLTKLVVGHLERGQNSMAPRYNCVAIPSETEPGKFINMFADDPTAQQLQSRRQGVQVSRCIPDFVAMCLR